MLEAGVVIKQFGKELLSALPKDSKMFQVCNNIMNQIYWVNASLKSISPVNEMVHNVPVSDFDAFEMLWCPCKREGTTTGTLILQIRGFDTKDLFG